MDDVLYPEQLRPSVVPKNLRKFFDVVIPVGEDSHWNALEGVGRVSAGENCPLRAIEFRYLRNSRRETIATYTTLCSAFMFHQHPNNIIAKRITFGHRKAFSYAYRPFNGTAYQPCQKVNRMGACV